MRNMLIAMSLMGSTVFLLYFILKPLLKKFFPISTRVAFLKISMMFFIVPFPLIKNYYYDLLNFLFSFPIDDTPLVVEIINPITITQNEIILPEFSKAIIIISLFWILAALIIIIFYMKIYIKLKHILVSKSDKNNNNSIYEAVKACKQKLHISRNITILNSNCLEPITVGFFKPIIILPENVPENNQMDYLIKHELIHIKNKDFVFKLLALFITALHWFNPLAHILLHEINKTFECYCDELVVIEMSKDERIAYGNAIIDLSTENDLYGRVKYMPVSSFKSKNEKIMKARLKEMKNVKKYKKSNYIVSAVILTAVVLFNSLLVFAYSEYPIESWNIEHYIEYDDMRFIESSLVPKGKTNSVTGDFYFIDEDGQIYKITDDSENEKAGCRHSYKDGQVVRHTKNSNGGCTEDYYDTRYCTKCGDIKTEELVQTFSFKTCPH